MMNMTFQYLTVSCIPAIGYVPSISRNLTFIDGTIYFEHVADISWYYTIPIIFMYVIIFPGRKFFVANSVLLSLVRPLRPVPP